MELTNQKALDVLLKKPVFLASEARAMGIHPSRLSYYVKTNLVERIAHGVYRGVESTIEADFKWEDLIIVAQSVPNGVVCLVTALSIYNLTDEVPRKHWLAIPHATTAPERDNTRFIRMRDIVTGKVNYKLGKEVVCIFNQERTIVDAFRYLSKEIAIKALKEAIKPGRKIKFDMKKFQRYAKQFHLNLTPYILAITT